jgi:acyl-CoA reductase-like NAD-dependent aldehyde dehydrogenase
MIRDQMLIAGQQVDAASGITFTVLNPSNEQPMGEVPRAGPADVELAVAAARKGFKSWSSLGRSGGRYSLEEFTELKWVIVELGE